jgi:hypothetical protein
MTRRVGGVKTFDDAVYTMRKDIEPSAQWQPFQLGSRFASPSARDQQHTISTRIKLSIGRRNMRLTIFAEPQTSETPPAAREATLAGQLARASPCALGRPGLRLEIS